MILVMTKMAQQQLPNQKDKIRTCRPLGAQNQKKFRERGGATKNHIKLQ